MKKSLLLLFILLITLIYSTPVSGQVTITSYSIYSLGVGVNTSKPLSAELKTFQNCPYEDMTFELALFYNFKPHTYHRFSAGFGLNSQPLNENYINAFTLPLSLEIYPLQNFKKLSLVMELTPMSNVDFDEFNVRYLWGFRYRFGN